MIFMFTGSFAHSKGAFTAHSLFSDHFVEQPNVLVTGVATGFPAKRASKAFRASSALALPGFQHHQGDQRIEVYGFYQK